MPVQLKRPDSGEGGALPRWTRQHVSVPRGSVIPAHLHDGPVPSPYSAFVPLPFPPTAQYIPSGCCRGIRGKELSLHPHTKYTYVSARKLQETQNMQLCLPHSPAAAGGGAGGAGEGGGEGAAQPLE